MPRPDAEQPLVPSVLDRLIDFEPRVSTEAPASRSKQLSRIKEAVKRDLEWLLNTKQPPGPPPKLPHLEASLLTLGLPDFTSGSLAGVPEQERLRKAIEAAIRKFEPRLMGVVVTLVEGRELDRTLRFRIDAMLRVEPEPEPVTFDSVLELGSQAFVVRGETE
jgi:type VI secretion system protein ImpF